MSDFQREWGRLKDVASAMWYDSTLIRASLGGLTMAALTELVQELDLGFAPETAVLSSSAFLIEEIIRRMAGRSDSQHQSVRNATQVLGFRPLT